MSIFICFPQVVGLEIWQPKFIFCRPGTEPIRCIDKLLREPADHIEMPFPKCAINADATSDTANDTILPVTGKIAISQNMFLRYLASCLSKVPLFRTPPIRVFGV